MAPQKLDDIVTTGNRSIDTQHAIFLGIIEKLISAQDQEADEKYVELLFSELLKFSEFHFCSEENIMLENNYPEYSEHRKEHENVLAELRNRIFSLKYEYIDFANIETFIIEWFHNHTSTYDIKLGEYLEEKKS